MSQPLFKVIKPGVYTTIQDAGRFGYQSYGVPVSGAMDRYAFRMANYILGNHKNDAVLEISLLGTELLVIESNTIVITGAHLDARIDGEKAPLWKAFHVRKGQELTFRNPINGIRAYVGVVGGIATEKVLGSRSTFARGSIKKPIEQDDKIAAYPSPANRVGSKLSPKWIPTYETHIELRVIPCKNEELFTEESIDLFYKQPYKFLTGDRMGCRMEGTSPLTYKKSVNMLSEFTNFGTIQVPPSGQPIILLADSQTTGGYATMGTVITVDLWKIAQLPPHGRIQFKRVSVEEAQGLQNQWRYAIV